MDWAEGRDDTNAIMRDVWKIIQASPELDFLMLTKRAHKIAKSLPEFWPLDNVWMIVSVGCGKPTSRCLESGRPERDRIKELAAIEKCAVRGLSYEPAVGPLVEHVRDWPEFDSLDWVIYGGESGSKFRPEGEPGDPKKWAREMRDFCAERGIAFYHKQSAAHANETGKLLDGKAVHEIPVPRRGLR
jgi:protein gp37